MEPKKRPKKKAYYNTGSPSWWRNTQILMLGLILWSCQEKPSQHSFFPIEGETMGTTYHIIYAADQARPSLKQKVDSLLNLVNQSVSTYIPNSLISRLNQGKTINLAEEDPQQIEIFKKNFTTSQQIHSASDGYFDPTVMPLVNYWGFGYQARQSLENVDTNYIESILPYIGLSKINITLDDTQWKLPEKMELDFSAIAKGGAVDFIAQFFISEKIDNFLIEIGGETYGQGGGRSGEGWIIGINTPKEGALTMDIFDKIKIQDRAVATSGNYRNFYEVNGQKYAHTINPKTGFFEQKNIISATIIGPDCGTADALATSCIAAGLEASKKMMDRLEDYDAYFLYNNGSDSLLIYMTNGMKSYKY